MKNYKVITSLLIVWMLIIMSSCSRPSEEPGFSEPVHEYIIDDRDGFFSINLNIITILIIIVLAILIRYILILRKEHTSLRKKFKDIDWNLNILDRNQRKLDLHSTEINKSIQSIRDQLERYENQWIVHLPPEGEKEKTGIEPGIENDKNDTSVFFMPAPDNEGVFDDRKKSRHFIPAESVYKFTSDPHEPQKASFIIYEDANNMERAINYYSSILEKVCKADNAFNPHKKVVSTISPGIALLENNKWIVKQKALVRYE